MFCCASFSGTRADGSRLRNSVNCRVVNTGVAAHAIAGHDISSRLEKTRDWQSLLESVNG